MTPRLAMHESTVLHRLAKAKPQIKRSRTFRDSHTQRESIIKLINIPSPNPLVYLLDARSVLLLRQSGNNLDYPHGPARTIRLPHFRE